MVSPYTPGEMPPSVSNYNEAMALSQRHNTQSRTNYLLISASNPQSGPSVTYITSVVEYFDNKAALKYVISALQ